MRTFVGHRRNVRMIRSDSFKTDWVISRNHLCISGDGSYKIGHFLKENGGEWLIWKRNPPLLSNMRSLGTPYSECKSTFKLLTKDL